MAGEATIYSMPQQFRNGQAGTLREPAAAKAAAPLARVAPVPVAPPKPVAVPVQRPTAPQRTGVKIALGILAVLVLLLGSTVVVLLTTPPAPAPVTQIPLVTEVPPVTEIPPVIEVPVPSVPLVPVPDIDTDSDGLTDVEEALYGTGVQNPDSDADQYLDGNEVFHLYDPMQATPATLQQSTAMRLETLLAGSFVSPQGLIREALENSLRFSSQSGAVMTVAVQPLSGTNLVEWYAANIGQDVPAPRVTKRGNQALVTPDGLRAYVLLGDLVYTFSYQLPPTNKIEFLQTFMMLYNSLTMIR